MRRPGLHHDAAILIDSCELIYNLAIRSKSHLLTTVCHGLHSGKLYFLLLTILEAGKQNRT